MIVVVDYGMGNLRSVQKALEEVGGRAVVSGDPGALRAARGLVLPGVGAFGDAMRSLRDRRLLRPLREYLEEDRPLLGICLGLQLLFEQSEEMGRHAGLGILAGRVVRFANGGGLRVPHVGWNQVWPRRPSPLLAGIAPGAYTYFVHSYYVVPDDPEVVLARTDYGPPYASVVGRGNVLGVQFHPEKSQQVGLGLLANWLRIVEGADGPTARAGGGEAEP